MSVESGNIVRESNFVRNLFMLSVLAWFNTSSFVATPPGAFGNLGFNALRGPGRQNWKSLLVQRVHPQRRSREPHRIPAESFNTFDHTQFGGPGQNGGVSTNLGASNFGAITAAWDPRVFQLGLKLIY